MAGGPLPPNNAWRADCRPRPSRILILLCLLVHALAAVAVCTAYIPFWAKLAALPFLPLLAWFSLQRLLLHRTDAVIAFREQGEGWWLDFAKGEGGPAVLHENAVVWRFLLILYFAVEREGRKPHTLAVVILPDSLGADAFRRLYVRIRFRRHAPISPITEA